MSYYGIKWVWNGGISMISDMGNDDVDLDSQVKLLRFAYGLDNWKELIELSDKLYQDALRIYNLTLIAGHQIGLSKPQRPLVYYIGISKLMQGLAFQKIFNFKESRKCILAYSDWDWIKETNERIDTEISNFIELASLNKRVLDILEGDSSQVDGYIDYIIENNRELTAGLLTLLEANRINGLDIRSVDNMFENHAKNEIAKNIIETDKPSYLKFLYEYTLYKIRVTSKNDAINTLLYCLSNSAKINTVNPFIIKYIDLFEKLRESVTAEQVKRYQVILSEVVSDEKIEAGV